MNEFKRMKFWFNAGEEDLRQRVLDQLVSQGYSLNLNIPENKARTQPQGIYTDSRGNVGAATTEKGQWWNYRLTDHEEINIDWMRSAKPETIELDGKTYIKSELEEALRKIKPVSE